MIASRFAYGEVINKDKLDMIYSAECYIRSLGFEQFRVRLQDAFFEKLGINPKIDTMQNIFTMPQQNIR